MCCRSLFWEITHFLWISSVCKKVLQIKIHSSLVENMLAYAILKNAKNFKQVIGYGGHPWEVGIPELRALPSVPLEREASGEDAGAPLRVVGVCMGTPAPAAVQQSAMWCMAKLPTQKTTWKGVCPQQAGAAAEWMQAPAGTEGPAAHYTSDKRASLHYL